MACLFPTRSRAAAACAGGKVELNGRRASAHHLVRAGDELRITFERGRRSFRVAAVAERHVKKVDARSLYAETTTPPTAEELEARRLERLLAPRRDPSAGRPTRKERREKERFRGF